MRRTLAVAGNGMVGHKLVETLVQRGATAEWDIHVFGEEARHAYDRVGLSSLFDGVQPDELTLVEPEFYDAYGLTPAEVALLWQTAPPRMPGEPPGR